MSWKGIEVVITRTTRNRFVGFPDTWVRIPSFPPTKSTTLALRPARAFLFATRIDNEQGYLRNFVASIVACATESQCWDFSCESDG